MRKTIPALSAALAFATALGTTAPAHAKPFSIDRGLGVDGDIPFVIAECTDGKPGDALMVPISKDSLARVLDETITPPAPTAPSTIESYTFIIDSKGGFRLATDPMTAARLKSEIVEGTFEPAVSPAQGADRDLHSIMRDICAPKMM